MVTVGDQTHYGDQFIMYKNVESLCHVPEINMILKVNCTSIKKKNKNVLFDKTMTC